MMPRLCAVLLLIAFVVTPVRSGEKYHLYGHGSGSCGGWLAAAATKDEPGQYLSYGVKVAWVLGWVSAAGHYEGATLSDTDLPGIEASVTTYCQAHPLETIAKAAGAVVATLKQQAR